MNVTVEDLAACKKLLRVELEAQKVDAEFDEATKQFQRHASLPGFRPGKAPKDMVVKRFEREIQEEVKTKLTREAYQNALKEKNVQVVRLQDIEEVQFGKGQPYQFIATVETAPDFQLPEYKGIPIKRESANVTDADVNKALNMLRERQAKFETVQRELKDGDVAVVNYKATCEGKPLTDLAPTAKGLTEKQNFWIDIRKDSFIPGFTEQLVGAKAGDKRTVNVDFPADFVTPQLAGKKGVYEVEVVEVKQRELPALDDTLAKAYGAETLDSLREGVRQDLQNEVNMKQKRSMREQAVQALLDQITCELPESMVQQETRNVVYNVVDENSRRGVPKELIDSQKDQIYSNASRVAKDRVKAMFLFQKIAEKEGIRVDQQDMMQRIQYLATQYQMTPDKLVKELEKNNGFGEIHEALLSEKVIEHLVQNAKVEDITAPAAPAA